VIESAPGDASGALSTSARERWYQPLQFGHLTITKAYSQLLPARHRPEVAVSVLQRAVSGDLTEAEAASTVAILGRALGGGGTPAGERNSSKPS
jgi:hypothetical protein